MILDDCALKDESVAILLEALANKYSLITLYLSRVEIGAKSVIAFDRLMDESPNLVNIIIIDPVIKPSHQQNVMQILAQHPKKL